MPLVLTLREGEDVYVGPQRWVLVRRFAQDEAVLQTEGKSVHLDSRKWQQLSEGCEVRVGLPKAGDPRCVRIQFNAPKELVLRGTTYRNKEKDHGNHEG